jgi:hypothetical protein
MNNSFLIQENAEMLSKFDEMHQEAFKFFRNYTSVWFQNVLLKTLIQHESFLYGSDDLSKEDIEVLTHSDRTMILVALAEYGIFRLLAMAKNMSTKGLEDNRPYTKNDPKVDSLLLVLYNLIDLDIDEFRHHSPVINDDDFSQEALN